MLITNNVRTAIDEYIKIVFKSVKEETKKHVKVWPYQSKSYRADEKIQQLNYLSEQVWQSRCYSVASPWLVKIPSFYFFWIFFSR